VPGWSATIALAAACEKVPSGPRKANKTLGLQGSGRVRHAGQPTGGGELIGTTSSGLCDEQRASATQCAEHPGHGKLGLLVLPDDDQRPAGGGPLRLGVRVPARFRAIFSAQ